MNLTRLSLSNPAAVAVVAVLIAVAGLVSLFKLPIQLLPAIDQPQISVWTNWRGAAPADMESVVIEQQERVLRAIAGLERVESQINQGNGNVNLTFAIGTDMQRAYLDVINRLQQVPPLPRDADGPWVNLGGWDFSGGNAASLLVRTLSEDDPRDPVEFHDIIKREVEPRLGRIPGVARVDLSSHRPEEVRVELDAEKAAAMAIDLPAIVSALNSAADVSGGFADVGRRQYTVRFLGQVPVESLGELIIAYRDARPVYLRDVASVSVEREESRGFTLRNGYPAYYIQLARESGSNTVTILDQVNREIDVLNDGLLSSEGLAIELSYDASIHIRRAIALVQGNLVLGGILATLVLFVFLRQWRSTLLVGLSIPICLFTAFAALQLTGRSLNVISLAGLAFAVGLVLDASIVVLENIIRLREQGEDLTRAVAQGASEVAPALFASTATSIAIFLPILFMQGPEGQLFADLALTLSIAVSVSLIAALTVLPVAGAWMLRGTPVASDHLSSWWDKVTSLAMQWTERFWQRALWAVLLIVGAALLTWRLMPSADYLPQARSDNVWGNFSVPPGASQKAIRDDLGEVVVDRLKPYMSGEKQPKVAYYNLSSWNGDWTGLALYPENPKEADPMMQALREDVLAGLPDTRVFVNPGSLLNFAGGGNRQIDMDIHGSDLDRLIAAARAGQARLAEVMPGVPVQPRPDLDLAEPELLVEPDDVRLARAQMSRTALGNVVRTYTDGLYVGEYFNGNDRMNIILRAPQWSTPEDLADMPISTAGAGVQRLGQLASFQRSVGPSELRRIDGQRTVTLRIFPPDEQTLEDVIEVLRRDVQPAIMEVLDGDGGVNFRGSADGLEQALTSMGLNLFYALLILLLILTAMFRSVRDAVLVVAVMPLAFAGGVIALSLLNLFTYQSMDLLTMSGFVILLGLVVNNSILLVDRTRSAERQGLARAQAVAVAVRERTRPIYMSTLTSIFGMLPLMLVPGTGAEIYRGLATIIVGGLSVSALFTLLLMPALLRMGQARDKQPIPMTTETLG